MRNKYIFPRLSTLACGVSSGYVTIVARCLRFLANVFIVNVSFRFSLTHIDTVCGFDYKIRFIPL